MELNQTSIGYYDRRLQRTATCTESTDAIVPDTFPDIGRIACAYGTAAIKDQTPQNDRLLVSGMVRTTVVYQPENGDELRQLSIPISFAHIEECEGLDSEAACLVACHVAGVEAVPVNSRKLTVSAQLCFEAEGFQKTECAVTESVELPDVEMLRTPRTVTLVEQAQVCPITILEDATLPDAADLTLLHAACTLRVTECRAMHGKVVLKGEAAVNCLAMQPDDSVRTLSNSTPFTQILEMPEVGEGDPVSARLSAREVDCRLEPDGLLSYTVNAAALITMRRTQTLSEINDLYLPGKELHLQQEKVTLHHMPPASPFVGEASETLQTAHRVSHIISANARCCGAKRVDGDTMQLTTAAQVLYLDEDQRLCSLQRTLPLSVPCAVQGDLSQIELTARGTSAGEQGILLAVGVSGMMAAEEHCAFRSITDIEVDEAQQDLGGVTLVMRYIDSEQPLWDIAKSCGTTMDAIRSANDLPADAAAVSETMLLIPIQG